MSKVKEFQILKKHASNNNATAFMQHYRVKQEFYNLQKGFLGMWVLRKVGP